MEREEGLKESSDCSSIKEKQVIALTTSDAPIGFASNFELLLFLLDLFMISPYDLKDEAEFFWDNKLICDRIRMIQASSVNHLTSEMEFLW